MIQLFGALVTMVFLWASGGLFVAVAVMLGKSELVLLLVILLLACMVKRSGGEESPWPYMQDLPLVGDATRILGSLQNFYGENPPRSILYYLFYPVTGVLGFWISPERTRRELARYFQWIHWIILILFIEGFLVIADLSQTFNARFAIQWAILEFILVYFLCHFFAIPCMVSAIRLSLRRSYRLLFIVVTSTLIALGGSFYYFSRVHHFDYLIPTDIVLKEKLTPKNANVRSPFLAQMQESTRMFLNHHLPELREQLEKGACGEDLLPALNEKYQQAMSGYSVYGEHRLFSFTTNQTPDDIGGLVCVPLKNSLLFAFRYQNARLKMYSGWGEMSAEEQTAFRSAWNEDAYRPYWEKNLARVILEETREAMDKLGKMMPRQASQKSAPAMEMEEARSAAAPQKVAADVPPDIFADPGNFEEIESQWEEKSQRFQEIEARAQGGRETLREMTQELLRDLSMFRRLPPEYFLDTPVMFVRIRSLWRQNFPVQIPESFRERELALRDWETALAQCRDSHVACRALVARNKRDELKRQLEIYSAKLDALINRPMPDYEEMTRQVGRIREKFAGYVRSTFVVYGRGMAALDFPRALQWKLIDDHAGQGPQAREESTANRIFGLCFGGLLFLFAAFMPMHVLLIILCYRRENRRQSQI